MSSVTDDKVSAAIENCWYHLESFYAGVFEEVAIVPDSPVWPRLTQMEEGLWKALSERPLTSMKIRALMADFERRFKKLCLDAKESGGTTPRGGSAPS